MLIVFLFKISLTINKNFKARSARKVREKAAKRTLQKKVRAKAAESRKVCVKGAKRPSCVCEGRGAAKSGRDAPEAYV